MNALSWLARISLQVVAGAEGLAGAGNDHDAHRLAGADGHQFGLQGGEHGLGQGVELTRPVERQRRQAVRAVVAQDEGSGLVAVVMAFSG